MTKQRQRQQILAKKKKQQIFFAYLVEVTIYDRQVGGSITVEVPEILLIIQNYSLVTRKINHKESLFY